MMPAERFFSPDAGMKLRSTLIICTLMLSIDAAGQKAVPESPRLIEVAQFGAYQPIGVAVTRSGRAFVSFPRRQPYRYGVVELLPDGRQLPYPDAAWNEYDSTRPRDRFMNAQAVVADDRNNLWILDPSNPGEKATVAAGVKLLKVSLSTNNVERIYRFEDLPREQGALNDVRIDSRRNLAYLSDPKLAAIIVLDLASGKSRMVLRGKPVVKADPQFSLFLDGNEVKDEEGKPFSSNVNGIALTHDGRWLYFRAINQTKLYRIDTRYLADAALSDDALLRQVELVGETGVCHGMDADDEGNIFLTESPGKSIRYVTPKGRIETLVTDGRLIWPDSFAPGPDGFLYVTASQINRLPKYNNGVDKVDYPFRLYKVKLP
jgi:sugar lactone lactonase YvrE